MSNVDPIATDIEQVLRSGFPAAAAANDPVTELRERGAEHVRALGLPERRHEAWRYTPLAFLRRAEYRPYMGGPVEALQPSDIDDLLLEGHDGMRLVFVNGHFAPALSVLSPGKGSVSIGTLANGLQGAPDAIRDHFDKVSQHGNLFAALNTALMSDGALIHVADGAELDAPIEILHIAVGDDEPVMFHPRHLVVLGEHAKVDLIERYVSLGDAVYFDNVLVEVVLGEDARLSHQYLQQESEQAQHLNDLSVVLAARSQYTYTLGALGGNWSRGNVNVRFAGRDATADLNGLLLARDGQLNDVHLDIDHAVPDCTSRETFKSILDGSGKVVFDGRILVARDAQKTDAALSNHNLMLSRSAEVDTKPQLEIFADDVKCSHGTTVGELDKDMLFYLRSRGLPEAQATRMLCQGFAADVLARFEDEALRKQAMRQIDERLAQAGAGG